MPKLPLPLGPSEEQLAVQSSWRHKGQPRRVARLGIRCDPYLGSFNHEALEDIGGMEVQHGVWIEGLQSIRSFFARWLQDIIKSTTREDRSRMGCAGPRTPKSKRRSPLKVSEARGHKVWNSPRPLHFIAVTLAPKDLAQGQLTLLHPT